MGLPGVKVGPLDPDATKEFGGVAATNAARSLIRLHAQAHPVALTSQLGRKLDPERTKAVREHLDEVREYLAGQTLENGDPVVPEDAEIVGATVRGEHDTPQVLTFTYRLPSGRTGKWFAPYDREGLPESAEAGDAYVKVQEMRDRGVVSFDSQATDTELLRREGSRLRRENEALRRSIERGDGAPDEEEQAIDVRADDQIVEENSQLRQANAELLERVTALEQLHGERAEESVREQAAETAGRARRRRGEDQAAQDSVAGEEPPVEGYDDLNSDQAIALLRSSETGDDQRRAIVEYERRHANRRKVVAAGEESLGAGV